ncbi:hypothetical protein [Candidatus Chazhemtobacterium aquaticus]|uniref:Uncharacterized protein n=1 Tax=Candidatus Chazhemtobacterium aquaticus TaxID=2715735 RepID=A0A857N7U5_9BACT|nr:hypothetical protein [Candidatus Chazhemtobacterium aquaticus]QHO63439.1 hypothetical protein MICH65_0458 [Candidatus Chazhemtobacterium aquaticus]
MEREKIKAMITKMVMWSVKNHWLMLVLILGLQYISGEAIGGDKKWLEITGYQNWRMIHELNSKLILIVTGLLALEKGYLFLLRSRKI